MHLIFLHSLEMIKWECYVEFAEEIMREFRELKEVLKSTQDLCGQHRKRLLTVSEAAIYLGIGKTEVYNRLREYVEPVMHGKKLLFPIEELDNFIEEAKIRGHLFY